MASSDFIAEFFVNPIKFPGTYAPYNAYNTIAYAVIGLVAAFLIYKAMQRDGLRLDRRFFYAVLPFVFFGGIFRVFEDAHIAPRIVDIAGFELFPFVTPGVYFFVFFTLAAAYLVAKLARKMYKLDVYSTVQTIGTALAVLSFACLFATTPIHQPYLLYGFEILALALGGVALFEVAKNFVKLPALSFPHVNLERVAVFAQAFDGAATFIAVSFAGYSEQHIVANILFGVGSPLLFFAIKLLLPMAIVHVLRSEAKNEGEHAFVLMLITIFGLAPGLRDTLRLVLGV